MTRKPDRFYITGKDAFGNPVAETIDVVRSDFGLDHQVVSERGIDNPGGRPKLLVLTTCLCGWKGLKGQFAKHVIKSVKNPMPDSKELAEYYRAITEG